MNLYEMYVDGDKFYDPRVQELALIDPQLSLELNSAGELTFTIPPTHPKYNSFKPLKSTIEVFRNGEWMWEGRIIDDKADFDNCVTYTCEGALAYLNDSIQPQEHYEGVTPIGYVEQILNVHNSQVEENRKINLGAIVVKDPNNYMTCYTNYNPTLQELKEDIIDDLGGYIRFRKVDGQLYLDILDDWPRTCSQVIRLGENLIDLTPTHDFSDIASVIIPLGAALEDQGDSSQVDALEKYVEIGEVNEGKNYIAQKELKDEYGKIWRVLRFDGIHFPDLLLKKAKEYFTDGRWGEMVIEAKAFDLNYTSEEFQEFQMLDKVRVISEVHHLDRYFPITAQTIFFNNISENTITLGGIGEPVSITGVTNQVTMDTSHLSERVKDPNVLLQQAIDQATQLIQQGINGYVVVNENEILIMDTNDKETAKHVWRWNMGGLGYSNNGYNGPFETAITMDGTISGKFLAANTVAAEQLDVSYKSHVEEMIGDAETGANDYTDSKLKDYPTRMEQETYFKTEADRILAGVNTTLESYYTSEQIESKFEILQNEINLSVSQTITSSLDGYPTREEMMAAIQVSADSITATLSKYASADDLKTLQTKLTAEGIFAMITEGLRGDQSIKNTIFTFDKNGITVVNGGLTILDADGNIILTSLKENGFDFRDEVAIRSKDGFMGWYITDTSIIYSYDWDDIVNANRGAIHGNERGISLFGMYEAGVSGGEVTLSSGSIVLDFGQTTSGTLTVIKRQSYTGYTGTINGAQFVNGICVG